ncbi:hypothetical protein [Bradyrhizobium sp. CCBAU 51753]|uniref:hypothetical protein n=1 Tax=Bradyrhizobium sp. CCBAU 51753 TaxID=1325100 RepID=UPI00188CFF90|nr:hypothetical protein [Bradyrhizobium sp. CCBAU 51753]
MSQFKHSCKNPAYKINHNLFTNDPNALTPHLQKCCLLVTPASPQVICGQLFDGSRNLEIVLLVREAAAGRAGAAHGK